MPSAPLDIFWEVLAGTMLTLMFIISIIAVVILNQKKFISVQKARIDEAKRHQEILREMPSRILEAHEDERRRVAKELHDGINQMLTAVKFQLHAINKQVPNGGPILSERIRFVSSELEKTMEEVKRVAHNLRPEIIDHLGLTASARSLCEEFSNRTGIRAVCEFEMLPEGLPPPVELGIYRIIQESLCNVEKHSGATMVSVRAELLGPAFGVVIADDGRGFEPVSSGNPGKGTGLGLQTMRERAMLLHGTLVIESSPSRGTKISVTLPIL